MKALIWTIFLITLGLIISGLILDVENSKKLVGFGVIGLFFVVFPLFSYYRWKDKDAKDYMLTKENLDKMRENQKDKKY
jgi:membrane protein DedA with SNARE-associated domain